MENKSDRVQLPSNFNLPAFIEILQSKLSVVAEVRLPMFYITGRYVQCRKGDLAHQEFHDTKLPDALKLILKDTVKIGQNSPFVLVAEHQTEDPLPSLFVEDMSTLPARGRRIL
jgi:hypothetical protein